MSAFVIVEIAIHDKEKYSEYIQLAPPSIAIYGGKYIARGGKTVSLEGSWEPERMVILSFPTVKNAEDWWNSKEYAAAKAIRHQTATSKMIILEGLAEPI
jgi:uncharacterized protein (DUF1330 family)